MKVFVTGGAGYLGEAVVAQLLERGHHVLGIARTQAAASRLDQLGAESLLADLRAVSTWLPPARSCEGFVHLAQDQGPDRVALDRTVIEALITAGVETTGPRHLIYTSTLFGLGSSVEPLDESAPPNPTEYSAARLSHERRVLAAASGNFLTSVVRPGMVYGGGAGGTVSDMIRSGLELGDVGVVGAGNNRWSLVHRSDVGTLYAMVLEARASGIFHAVDDHPLPVTEIASAVAAATGAGSVTHVAVEEAALMWGGFAEALALDQPAVAIRAAELGWRPGRPSFVASLPAAIQEWKDASTRT